MLFWNLFSGYLIPNSAISILPMVDYMPTSQNSESKYSLLGISRKVLLMWIQRRNKRRGERYALCAKTLNVVPKPIPYSTIAELLCHAAELAQYGMESPELFT